ncbi:MAG: M24 family metallopeptidase [Actinomycetes bacterium]
MADAELPERLGRLAALAREHGAATVVLREQASLSWLLGTRSHVPQTLDAACFDVVVTAGVEPRLTVVTNAIEAPRLRDTELADVAADWQVVPWWQGRDGALPAGDDVVADRAYAGARDVGPQVAALRRVLGAHQRDALRSVCRDAAAAATAAAGRLTPATTEYAAAGALAAELLERALDPVVLLVAGHTRIAGHRHPLPTTAALGPRAMLVCCARRDGLIASVTRIVALGAPPAGLDRYRALLEVERVFLDASRAGVRIGDVVARGTEAYAANGFAADEWHRHHQGGFSGWQPREYPAHPGSDDVVPEHSVVAWNTSGDGWKVEDTCLVTAGGVEPLVDDGRWPTVEVGGRRRPDVLTLT